MGYFSIFTPKQHAHPGATTGMTLWKTELTSHKLALVCFNPCLTKNYWQAQSVIHSLATRPSSPGSLRRTRNSQGESLTSRLYSVVLSYELVISYTCILAASQSVSSHGLFYTGDLSTGVCILISFSLLFLQSLSSYITSSNSLVDHNLAWIQSSTNFPMKSPVSSACHHHTLIVHSLYQALKPKAKVVLPVLFEV